MTTSVKGPLFLPEWGGGGGVLAPSVLSPSLSLCRAAAWGWQVFSHWQGLNYYSLKDVVQERD